ncbi:MAG TPA: hypothetical protein VME92_02570 [Acetobacteraceae bacterium]|nr:hypothetical protein [Acetobacteraceae bacterium]
MQNADIVQTAKALLQRHGFRAQAVAEEKTQELRGSGDAAELARWEAIGAALRELRQNPTKH